MQISQCTKFAWQNLRSHVSAVVLVGLARFVSPHRAHVPRTLWSDRRGVTYIEYLILVGLLAMGLLGAFRAFNTSVDKTSDAEARAVVSLTWDGKTQKASYSAPALSLDGFGPKTSEHSQKKECSGFWSCAWEKTKDVAGSAVDTVGGWLSSAADALSEVPWGTVLGIAVAVVVGIALTVFTAGLLGPLVGVTLAAIIAGVIGGAVGGALGQIVENLIDDGKINWGEVGWAALIGGVTGGVFAGVGAAVAKVAGTQFGQAILGKIASSSTIKAISGVFGRFGKSADDLVMVFRRGSASPSGGAVSLKQLRNVLGRAGVSPRNYNLVKASEEVLKQLDRDVYGWVSRDGAGKLILDARSRPIINFTQKGLSSIEEAVKTFGHEVHHIKDYLAGLDTSSEALAETAGEKLWAVVSRSLAR